MSGSGVIFSMILQHLYKYPILTIQTRGFHGWDGHLGLLYGREAYNCDVSFDGADVY